MNINTVRNFMVITLTAIGGLSLLSVSVHRLWTFVHQSLRRTQGKRLGARLIALARDAAAAALRLSWQVIRVIAFVVVLLLLYATVVQGLVRLGVIRITGNGFAPGSGVDRRSLAAITVLGLICGIFGSLYLAYGLLEDEKYQPLRRLTLAVIFTATIALLQWCDASFFVPGACTLMNCPISQDVTALLSGLAVFLSGAVAYGAVRHPPQRKPSLGAVLLFPTVLILSIAITPVFVDAIPWQPSTLPGSVGQMIVIYLPAFALMTVSSPVAWWIETHMKGRLPSYAGAVLVLIGFLLQLFAPLIEVFGVAIR